MPMQATKTAPLFAAILRPDISLRMAGGWLGLGFAAISATPFALAAPELLAPGLVAMALAGGTLIALGLRQSRRRRWMQQVTLWPDQLEISTQAPGRPANMWRASPSAVRLRLERDENERIIGLFVRHEQTEIELGAFLSVADRSSFARAFGRSLRRARLVH